MLSVRYKIMFIVLPLLIASLVILSVLSIGFSRNGITKIASEFLGYKINQVIQKANNEVENLKTSDFKDDILFIDEVKKGIELYAGSIIKQQIESFVAIDDKGVVTLSTDPFLKIGSEVDFFDKLTSKNGDWISFKLQGVDKVGFYGYFEEWNYYFLISVYSTMFYRDADTIVKNSIFILISSILIMAILLFIFITYIIKPLNNVVTTMNDIIKLNDLSSRVPVQFNDEIGELAFTFNNMLEELEGAYNKIKEYAFQSVLAQKKEERIKNMFQKYVPQDVVNEIVNNPDQALIGKNSNLSVLFSDIRSFTTISESMTPADLVDSLNRYFTEMVDIIYKRRGVIDKYIGDAIMAIFGAPKSYGDDPQQAVLSGLEMLESLDIFNKQQRDKGYKEFKIGVGINYGPVVVGNIGTSQKMDYTVIGDAVNLASRLEGLTKEYHTELIISEGTYEAVKNYFYVREIDRVFVKGKLKPVKIFEPARKLTTQVKQGWQLYNKGLYYYHNRAWDDAEKHFLKALEFIKDDFLTIKYIDQTKNLKINPPDENWDGTTIMTHK